DPLDGAFEALEHMAENAVELVEMALVLHQRGARQIIKIVDLLARDAGIDRVEEGEIFLHAHRNAGLLQLEEEVQEHGIAPTRPGNSYTRGRTMPPGPL